jgi:hypothetical protein
MQIKQADGMDVFVTVACSQLLKYIHIPELEIIGCGRMKIEASEKPVLVEIIVHDLFAEIHMQFIVQHKGNRSRREGFLSQRDVEEEIIPQFPIVIITVCEVIIVRNFVPELFFQPDPLHQPEPRVFGMPLQLLPDPVFWL